MSNSPSLRKISNASSLLDLAAACNSAVRTLPDEINDLTKTVATSLIFKLIYITPVDTTEAMSNWQVGLMFSEVNRLPPYFYGHDGITAGMSEAAAFAVAKGVISQRKVYAPIYISNNAPHIEELENGKSQQQAAGFIARTVQEISAEAITEVRLHFNGN